jgi:hypothetical protein
LEFNTYLGTYTTVCMVHWFETFLLILLLFISGKKSIGQLLIGALSLKSSLRKVQQVCPKYLKFLLSFLEYSDLKAFCRQGWHWTFNKPREIQNMLPRAIFKNLCWYSALQGPILWTEVMYLHSMPSSVKTNCSINCRVRLLSQNISTMYLGAYVLKPRNCCHHWVTAKRHTYI